MLTPVILSGGIGSRLWPLSREHYPKQLLNLLGEQSMLQATISRLQGIPNLAPPIVVCNEAHRFLVAEQLRSIGIAPSAILLEPVGRNTAPAAAIAALAALEQDKNGELLLLPADHLIQDVKAFHAAVADAVQLAQQDYLVTFGIVPSHAETGYGYIQAGAALPLKQARKVAAFVEKPDAPTAARYVASGDYFWNSGMFMFKAQRYLDELGQYASEILEACERAFDNVNLDIERDFQRVDEQDFRACPSNSIDYAVMERTQSAAVVPLDAGWNDIGAWSSLWAVSEQDAQGNTLHGDVMMKDCKNNYLRAEYRLLAVLGVEDLVVVETADAVLVAHKDKVQDVKYIVAHLKDTARSEVDLHRKVLRPWGTYETMDEDARFLVKRITVKPGASLSMQMHHHRSEHWIVVKGTAKIYCGTERFLLSENQSTYIPLGTRHRLENPGKLPLEIIEVQSGAYLGEDDIVRFEDQYGR